MQKFKLLELLKPVALIGNIAYILFLIYNGIDEGFKFRVQSIAPIGMIFLLAINIFLLLNLKNKNEK